MSYFLSVLNTFFLIYPTWFSIGILGFFTVLSIIMIMKIVAFAKDVIPFL